MKRLLPLLLAAASCGTVLEAQAQPAAPLGKQVYDRWCLDCHGAGEGFAGLGLTGTGALREKYKGALPELLEERTDLTPELVAVFVRRGVSVMPFFRRTEISDAELAALGEYLSRLNPALRPQGAARP